MTGTISEPKVGRPKMPEGYGLPENDDNLLPWSYVVEHMQAARNYWIGTVTPGGAPAATPVWGAWVDGKLYFDGSPETRRGRNLKQNPRTVVHLESGDQVVILEGTTRIYTTAPDRALATKVAAAYTEKYKKDNYAPEPTQWDQGGLFEFTPKSVMGWTQFPKDLTRWSFE